MPLSRTSAYLSAEPPEQTTTPAVTLPPCALFGGNTGNCVCHLLKLMLAVLYLLRSYRNFVLFYVWKQNAYLVNSVLQCIDVLLVAIIIVATVIH